MNLSEYAINSLVPYVTGDNFLTERKSGRELVEFFNRFGMRDLYSFHDGGLPRLQNRDRNTSRRDYTFDRLRKLNDTVQLQNLIEHIIQENQERNNIVDDLNDILADENYSIIQIDNLYLIEGAEDELDVVEVEPTFENIEQTILAELERAEFTIWVAMAWFTNNVIFEKLIEKRNRGVNIQIIVPDDQINRDHGCNIEVFESRRIPLNHYNNIMHNKFCVIDMKTVINGSYNWSRRAEFNQENITVLRGKRIAEEFAREFIRLKLN